MQSQISHIITPQEREGEGGVFARVSYGISASINALLVLHVVLPTPLVPVEFYSALLRLCSF